MTTANLLSKLVEQEKIDLEQTKLISQWRGDREMATTLNIREVIDSKTYFSPTKSNVMKAK
jgi:hypothetical protein